MKTETIIPIYGYGWMKGDAPIEVPSQFQFRLSRSEREAGNETVLVGQVITEDHEYKNLWVLLALRSVASGPAYNVFLYEEAPAFSVAGPVDPYAKPRFVTGFANLA